MTKEEYHQILFELGLLDDDDNWELFQKQEERFDIDTNLFLKYSNAKQK